MKQKMKKWEVKRDRERPRYGGRKTESGKTRERGTYRETKTD